MNFARHSKRQRTVRLRKLFLKTDNDYVFLFPHISGLMIYRQCLLQHIFDVLLLFSGVHCLMCLLLPWPCGFMNIPEGNVGVTLRHVWCNI